MTDESEDDSDSSQNAPATITVYPRGSNGNVKPIKTITGPLTSLAHPEGIAIGLANLTPPQPQALAFYDWSVTASPNLAADAPSREVVERFMVSIETSTADSYPPAERRSCVRTNSRIFATMGSCRWSRKPARTV